MVRCVLGGASTACPRYSIITVGRKQLANRRRHVPDSGKMFSGVTLSTRAVEDRQIGSSICPCAGVVLPMLAYHHDAASAVVCDIRVWQRPVVVIVGTFRASRVDVSQCSRSPVRLGFRENRLRMRLDSKGWEKRI